MSRRSRPPCGASLPAGLHSARSDVQRVLCWGSYGAATGLAQRVRAYLTVWRRLLQVPLVCLALTTSRLEPLDFECFLLSDLCSDLVGCSGHEAYVLCTLQVALGFLRMVDVSDGSDGRG